MEKFNNYVSNLEVLQYAGQQDLDNELKLPTPHGVLNLEKSIL